MVVNNELLPLACCFRQCCKVKPMVIKLTLLALDCTMSSPYDPGKINVLLYILFKQYLLDMEV